MAKQDLGEKETFNPTINLYLFIKILFDHNVYPVYNLTQLANLTIDFDIVWKEDFNG